jgi:hypothetical protein
MGVIEGMANVPNYGGNLSRFKEVFLCAEVAKFLSLNEFHGDIKVATFFNHIIYGDNAGM